MSCPYFKSLHNIGVCSASSGTYIPSLDEMGSFCFKEEFYTCIVFCDCISDLGLPQRTKKQNAIYPKSLPIAVEA